MRKNTKFKFAAMASLWSAFGPLASAQISISPSSLGNFTSTVGSASNAQVLSLTATGPSGAIVVSAPQGFEVSNNATTGFARSITLGTPGGSIQSVYKGGFSTHTGNVWDNGSGNEFPNDNAFVAITANGAVVAWGDDYYGGNLDAVNQFLSSNVTKIISNAAAFAAIKSNGSVFSWGDIDSGGNSTVVNTLKINGNGTETEIGSVKDKLSANVTSISSSKFAFAALKDDGSVVTWGRIINGGNSTAILINEINNSWVINEGPTVAPRLSSNVTAIFSNWGAFAALKKNGEVVTWGEVNKGGNATVTSDVYWNNDNVTTTEGASVSEKLSSNVITVFSNSWAFAALKDDGSVVTWGHMESGGNSTVADSINTNGNWIVSEYKNVSGELSSNVTAIYSNSYAFAALKKNGSVVTWGDIESGGNSTVAKSINTNGNWTVSEYKSVSGELSSNVTTIYSNPWAFAALKKNGSVVTWGDLDSGGNSTRVLSSTINGTYNVVEVGSVDADIISGVVAVYSNDKAFAALKNDGSVVTWGDIRHGGNASITLTVESGESGNYTVITTELGSIANAISSNVTAIYSNKKAFAALKKDGSVIAWGDITSGGNLTTNYYVDGGKSIEYGGVASMVASGVVGIYSNEKAFAALKDDGSIVVWGDSGHGGNDLTENIGESASGLPSVAYVRMASNSQAGALSGNLTFSTLGAEIESMPLSGSFTGSADAGGNSGGSSAGGGGGGSAGSSQVQKSKKGKGKSSAKKSSGGSSKESKGSKSSSKKKSGGSKKSKK